MESAVRDELVAHPVLDPALRAALAAARSRDADIEVTATVATGQVPPGCFGSALQAVLRYAVRDSRVRAHWRSTADERGGSIVLVTPELADPQTAGSLTAELAAVLAAVLARGQTDPGAGGGADDRADPGTDAGASSAVEPAFRWTLDHESLFVEFGSSLR